MDVLLSRILKYLNGALFYDDSYKFCTYIVDHYLEMENITKQSCLIFLKLREPTSYPMSSVPQKLTSLKDKDK